MTMMEQEVKATTTATTTSPDPKKASGRRAVELSQSFLEELERWRPHQLFHGETLYCEGAHKPTWRGLLHQIAFYCAPIATGLLLQRSKTPTEWWAAIVFGVGSLLSFGASYLYHRVDWSPGLEVAIQKVDHCAIFFVTAGNLTPLILLGLQRTRLLTLFLCWSACVWGMVMVLTRQKKAYHHLISGGVILVGMHELAGYLTATEFYLQLASWTQYILGLVFYSNRWPKLWEDHFSSHELMHLMVVSASFTTFLCNYSLLQRFDPAQCLWAPRT